MALLVAVTAVAAKAIRQLQDNLAENPRVREFIARRAERTVKCSAVAFFTLALLMLFKKYSSSFCCIDPHTVIYFDESCMKTCVLEEMKDKGF